MAAVNTSETSENFTTLHGATSQESHLQTTNWFTQSWGSPAALLLVTYVSKSLHKRQWEENSILYRAQTEIHWGLWSLYRTDVAPPPSYVYGVNFFFSEDAKADKIENEVQRSKAQVETLWKKQKALLLHYRCTQLSASINVTSRLHSPSCPANPTHQTEVHSVHRYLQHTGRQTDRRTDRLEMFRLPTCTCLNIKLWNCKSMKILNVITETQTKSLTHSSYWTFILKGFPPRHHSIQTGSGDSRVQWVSGGPSPGIKQMEREND
jgi:hypothetical protein